MNVEDDVEDDDDDDDESMRSGDSTIESEQMERERRYECRDRI